LSMWHHSMYYLQSAYIQGLGTSFHPLNANFEGLFNTCSHWIYNLKLEMTLDKLQLIGTSVVLAPYKVRWLTWWNSSNLSREALHFPPRPVSKKDIDGWINKASFWAGMSFYSINLMNVEFSLHLYASNVSTMYLISINPSFSSISY
jgi:hypothetical protein